MAIYASFDKSDQQLEAVLEQIDSHPDLGALSQLLYPLASVGASVQLLNASLKICLIGESQLFAP